MKIKTISLIKDRSPELVITDGNANITQYGSTVYIGIAMGGPAL